MMIRKLCLDSGGDLFAVDPASGDTAAGIPFAIAYPVVAWTCWLVNIAAAEWWIRRTTRTWVRTPPIAELVSR